MTAPKESKALTAVEEVKGMIAKLEPTFRAALPAHIAPDKFIRVAQTAIQTSPDLLNADRQSLYAACTKAAQDGLLPDGKEAALVVFSTKVGEQWIKKVQFMPMIAGILKKVRNSGELSSIVANVVYKNDDFTYKVDSDGEHLLHYPLLFGERGERLGVYALAKTKDGAVYIEVMTEAEIEQVRAVSKAGKSGPWAQWWSEMAKKTVMRRLAKRLPMNTDLEDSIHADDEMFEPETKEVGQATEVNTKPQRLGQLIESQSVKPETEVEAIEVEQEAQVPI